jgi:hypothetical protein
MIKVKKRIEADFYPTPLSAFKPIIPFLPKDGGQIWDPCWGDTRLVKWMLEAGLDAWGADLNDSQCPVDFLTDTTRRFCIATNPPFSLAWEFCKHAVKHAEHVFLLLRLCFLASRKRVVWFREHEPSALFVLSERPSFVRSVKCKNKLGCGYHVMLPLESTLPKKCPECGNRITVVASDYSDYFWGYWYQGDGSPLYTGVHHLI